MSDSTKQNTARVRVQLVKSLLGRPQKHHRVVRALGLRKLNDVVVHHDSQTIRGMINTVIHLVRVEPVV